MNEKQVDFWKKSREQCQRYMRPKHEDWRRLLRIYRLDFSRLKGLKLQDEKIARISRFYPLTRQIIAAISFHYPRTFFRVEDNNYEFSAEILERVTNASFEVMKVKPEVQQAVFDALYCNLGWLKCGVNPPGDKDLVAPYVANDAFQNGMVYWQRISPFNVFIDPLTPPHNLSYARFIMERMLVPYEFVKDDPTLKHRDQIKPLSDDDVKDHLLEDMQETVQDEEEEGSEREAKVAGQYVLLWEIHDRIHKRRIKFAEGVDQPVEDIPHPFLAGKSTFEIDGFGKKHLTGFQPTEGYLVEHGFPYHNIKFDLSDTSLYGKPMMEYVEDEQKIIVESVSRRRDMLKRNSRTILGQRAEQEENPDVGTNIERGRDNEIVWVNDVHNSFSEMPMNAIQPDQLGLESDMRQYEEQVLGVSEMAMGGGKRMTATQATLMASFGQLNQEWMQSEVAKAYEVIADNTLRIMSDERYTPVNFLVNVKESDQDPVYEAVTADMLRTRFKVHIEAGSMKPLFEELEREDTLALFSSIIQLPEVDRIESIRMLLRTFRVTNMDRLIGPAAHVDATKAAQLENQLMMNNQPVKVTDGEEHVTHIQTHQAVPNAPAFQQLAQAQPILAQQIIQTLQQHLTEHQEALQQKAQPGAGRPAEGIQSMGDQSPMGKVQQQLGQVDSAVRSNAQNISQNVQTDRNQG